MPSTDDDHPYVYPNPTPEHADYCVISDNPRFGEFKTNAAGTVTQHAVALRWEKIPDLIRDLRRAYNNRPAAPTFGDHDGQSPADGVVAAILLQTDPV